MKRNVLALLGVSIILSGCAEVTVPSNEKSEFESSISLSSEEHGEYLYVYSPDYYIEKSQFKISGRGEPGKEVVFTIGNEQVGELTIPDSGEFAWLSDMLDRDVQILVSDGVSEHRVSITSLATLKANEEEKAKAESESIAKKESEEQKSKAESESKAKADEERKSREAEKNSVSTEYRNALIKAESYLKYMPFSKTGLYDQLIYEQFSEDAAQWAVDFIETDWNEQALSKGKNYQETMAMSKQGVYDQLIYEGFTAEQAQFAIDNLPE